jgi:hypothetical protein
MRAALMQLGAWLAAFFERLPAAAGSFLSTVIEFQLIRNWGANPHRRRSFRLADHCGGN